MLRVLAATVAAALPHAGVLVPGKSLGGARLGSTPAQVRAAWGGLHGRCADCRHRTWYFTYAPFRQQGAGVEFRRGRAVALFTLWQPPGWRTRTGLRLGDPADRITARYEGLFRLECAGYSALTRSAPRAITAFYVVDDELWGFGLMRPSVPACR